jgi:hypothetical protein
VPEHRAVSVDLFQTLACALTIADRAKAVSEIKFDEILVHVPHPDVVEPTVHTAFEQGKVALDPAHVDLSLSAISGGVVNALM